MQDGSLIAAVDLGSNSFRMEIGRLDHGSVFRVDYLKETVRQGGGLDEQRNLTSEAMQRGWATLARFGERLAGFKSFQVRAVATQTLREARNRDLFLKKAEQLLGFPIDVISGREEARLIYQGVSQVLEGAQEKRLVMDIGGRSTELIVGIGSQPRAMESYRVGSVVWAERYFPNGRLDAQAFDTAIIAAKAVLDEAMTGFSKGWTAAYGSAGTIGAIADILHAGGRPEGWIEAKALVELRQQLQSAGHIDKLNLLALKEDRRPVLGAGLSVLIAVFDLLGIERMRAMDTGLRHGVLHDLIGRDSDTADIRSQSIERLARRFEVDALQAQRVQLAAEHFFANVIDSFDDVPEQSQRHQRKLRWASQLHEVGALISHSDCHKHSAYILENADVLGFSNNELHRLSLLVLGHKGKLRKLEADFEDVRFVQQLMSLRLAVLLCHARVAPALKGLSLNCHVASKNFTLSYTPSWASKFPQSMHLLQQEVQSWQKTSWTLALLLS
ncbi:Ppx/GppA family phosphatase [Variovorax sp. PCZ-1]|nr:Ppx/GppA phosphatase family protein [Variovorax sp. PCZ-1]MBS7806688.1 Ppx/GppA family phosphatase [Variovorax sp. PCZ-1]